jgi:hypothetical protein
MWLVKWLLALPHFAILAFFLGGGATVVAYSSSVGWTYGMSTGLVGVLLLIAGVALFFAGFYPRGIFDFVMGMNRWAIRVYAYTALMTDVYPPFRLDLGGRDQAAVTAPVTRTEPAEDR